MHYINSHEALKMWLIIQRSWENGTFLFTSHGFCFHSCHVILLKLLWFSISKMLPKVTKGGNTSQWHLQPAAHSASPPHSGSAPPPEASSMQSPTTDVIKLSFKHFSAIISCLLSLNCLLLKNVTEMESLSTCTHNIVTLQTRVEHTARLKNWSSKCDHLESRDRRQNIWDFRCPRGWSCLLLSHWRSSHWWTEPAGLWYLNPNPVTAPCWSCTTTQTVPISSGRRERYNW